MLRQLKKVLLVWPTHVGNNVTHPAPMTEQLTMLRRAVQEWRAKADELQTHPARERSIVLDTRGRAYSRTGTDSFKLQVPPVTFADVFLMDQRTAEAFQRWLTQHYAEFSPYCIRDAHTYAREHASKTEEVLKQLESVWPEEPATDGVEFRSEKTPSGSTSP